MRIFHIMLNIATFVDKGWVIVLLSLSHQFGRLVHWFDPHHQLRDLGAYVGQLFHPMP